MEDNNVDCVCSSTKEHLKEFIRVYSTCPEIWNSYCDDYRDKLKKNQAIDKLLNVYKKIKPDSTRYDVKKKLNSLRTNFRKEWKRVMKSKSTGGSYVPTNWTYYDLLFLTSGYKQPLRQHQEMNDSDDKEKNEWDDVDTYSESSMDPIPSTSATNVTKKTTDNQIAIDNDHSENQDEEEEYHLAKVWAKKLKTLEPTQKLYAEKAINDILYEAQLQNLRSIKDL